VPLATCDDALAFVRQVALDRMNKRIDDQIAAFDKGENCYARGEGDLANAGVSSGAPAPAAPATTSSPDTAKATTVSTTNNQVAGVDEADFVKNDDEFIYLAQNGVLRIIDAWPAASAHEISKTVLDGDPKKLFVVGNRALVYVSVPDPRRSSMSQGFYSGPSYGTGNDCTYGYECQFVGDGTSTKLEVFDITDRTAPMKIRDVFVSGSLIAARRVGNATHTVVADNLQLFPELTYSPTEDLCGYAQSTQLSFIQNPLQPPPMARATAHAAFEKLRATNAQIILTKDLAGVLPFLGDSAGPTNSLLSPMTLCTALYRSALSDGSSFTTVVSLDMVNDGPPTTASVVSSPGAVYASDTSLYIAVPSDQSYGGAWYDGLGSSQQASSIHKFRISANAGDTAYDSSGAIKGRVLNQFAMDELDGNLRVASTNGYVPDPNVDSQVTIIGPGDHALQQLGIVEHIGPKEDIRAVRFEGKQGFVVTFKKTDPLFALDLSDPASPKLTGELKIPGFSTYIHLLDDTHLLSIGYDANDHDSFAFFDGVLLQIFDISDPTNPTLAQRYKIGTRGTSSDALTDHLAFNYFAPLKMLAVPMTICEGGGDGTFGDQLTFSGLMLFDIDAATGIAEHGRVPYPVPDLSTYQGGTVSCNNWWTNASSDVSRSIFMDRFVYAISAEMLKVESVDSLGTDLQSIDLEPADPKSSTGSP
jgi:hypothetical protein